MFYLFYSIYFYTKYLHKENKKEYEKNKVDPHTSLD